jgi:hypothetical protein
MMPNDTDRAPAPARVQVESWSRRGNSFMSTVRRCARIPSDRRRAPCPASSSEASQVSRPVSQCTRLCRPAPQPEPQQAICRAGSIDFSPRYQGRSAPSPSWKAVISTTASSQAAPLHGTGDLPHVTRRAGFLGGEPTSPTERHRLDRQDDPDDVEGLIFPDGVDPMRRRPAGDLP